MESQRVGEIPHGGCFQPALLLAHFFINSKRVMQTRTSLHQAKLPSNMHAVYVTVEIRTLWSVGSVGIWYFHAMQRRRGCGTKFSEAMWSQNNDSVTSGFNRAIPSWFVEHRSCVLTRRNFREISEFESPAAGGPPMCCVAVAEDVYQRYIAQNFLEIFQWFFPYFSISFCFQYFLKCSIPHLPEY